ncbi:S24 family peptidase [Adhaeribacter aquaticus]|uniref:S24 family peptidase n=1 Tax=Adhaeribacter aquaticus TaxID=299567 RepID=UPI001B7FC0DC|nr:LexA family transcriptional regulator [Adhaeribacter aquaticus]
MQQLFQNISQLFQSNLQVSINQRIKILLDRYSNDNVLGFSKMIGVSHTTIATLLPGSRESKPGFEIIAKLLDRFPEISAEWLVRGEGDMFKSNKHTPIATELRTTDEVIIITPDTSDSVMVPMIDMKAAANYLSGYQSSGYYNSLGHTTLPGYMARGGTHYWLQVKGDSMETTLFEGDWLLCEQIPKDQWETAEDFNIYVVVSKDRGVQVKRIKNRLRSKGFLRCRSDNRAHKPYSVVHDDVLGLWKVKWYLSNYMPNRNEDLFNKVDTVEENIEDLRALTEQLMEEMNRMKKQLPPKGAE